MVDGWKFILKKNPINWSKFINRSMELNKVVTVLEALEDSKVVQKDKQQQ